ncbi:hypothetical protein [Hymenobacter persicinus]|uniref:Uncharacterized protein n=1 Tax=Hymenobacter persicinus TaxID=2025506 RepID=A0A4V1ZAA4_9BACT|nr:hypothetical protein [Hymenobacter persicinus]RYU76383.1 hypothetical protein EWM57_18775 [Hymenobacter persicinus]
MNSTNKKQLFAVIVLAALNFLVSHFTMGNGRTLEGQVVEAHSAEMRQAAITTLFFGIQLISFVLGALLAAVPYKSKAYTEKWITVSLAIAVVIQAIILVMGIAKLLM